MFKLDDKYHKQKFIGMNSDMDVYNYKNKQLVYLKAIARKKCYNKIIVNKWHLILMLARNPLLAMYRKCSDDNSSEASDIAKSRLRKCFDKLTCCCSKKNNVIQTSL